MVPHIPDGVCSCARCGNLRSSARFSRRRARCGTARPAGTLCSTWVSEVPERKGSYDLTNRTKGEGDPSVLQFRNVTPSNHGVLAVFLLSIRRDSKE